MVGDFAMTKCDPPPALVEGDFIGSAEAGTLWGRVDSAIIRISPLKRL